MPCQEVSTICFVFTLSITKPPSGASPNILGLWWQLKLVQTMESPRRGTYLGHFFQTIPESFPLHCLSHFGLQKQNKMQPRVAPWTCGETLGSDLLKSASVKSRLRSLKNKVWQDKSEVREVVFWRHHRVLKQEMEPLKKLQQLVKEDLRKTQEFLATCRSVCLSVCAKQM